LPFTIARFDLDDTPREANTERPTPVWSPLPVGFPFLVDDETGEVLEPALAFLIYKCHGAQSYRKRRWTKLNTAAAYAADLKDWWAHISRCGVEWSEADDEHAESYLLGMRMELSEHTESFLADATIARRRSTLNEFHKFARRRYGHKHLPIASVRSLRNTARDDDGEETFDAFELARYDANPRPIDDDDVPNLAERLGPRPGEQDEWSRNAPKRPSGRTRYPSSRTRLAFEIAWSAGLRVDEIVHLRAKLFENFDIEGLHDDDNIEVELDVTKGLVRRTVYFPVWLIVPLKQYIAGERAEAIAASRRNWLGKKASPPANLFLNTPAAGRNAGKRTTSKQLEADFHEAMMDLNLKVTRTKAEGTDTEHDVEVAAHSFHDARHSFAYVLYRDGMGELEGFQETVLERRFEDVVQNIRLRLGHQQVETTINIYLRVFNREGEKALRRLSQWARGVIERDRKNGN
jgi:integrase